MANQISTILDRLEAHLASVVAAGDLRAVVRGVINPLTVAAAPALGFTVSRLARSDGAHWTADVLLMLAVDSGADAAEERTIDAVAAVEESIATFKESGRSGGKIDGPTWDTWFIPTNDGRLQRVGAIGGMRIVVSGKLRT